MNITPLGERVLVLQHPQEKVTAGGIILPTGDKPGDTPVEHGTIMAIGPDVTGVEVAQHILFHRHAGAEIQEGDDTYQLLLAESILAVVNS